MADKKSYVWNNNGSLMSILGDDSTRGLRDQRTI